MENRTTIQISEKTRQELRKLAGKRDVSYQELLADMISVFKELDSDMSIISIPKKLMGRLNENVEKSDFKTVSEYVAFLLRLMIIEDVKLDGKKENIVKDRLKRLGYL